MAHIQYAPTIIVDRNALFRIGLAHTLAQTRFCVTAEYSSLNEIPAEAIPSTGCVFLIGLDDLVHESINKLSELRAGNDAIHVVFLGEHTSRSEVDKVMRFGGECYVLKNAVIPDMLLQYLELVMAGQTVFPKEFIRILRTEWCPAEEAATAPAAIAPVVETAPSATRVAAALDTSWELQRVISQFSDAPAACRLSERETAILMRLMHGAANKVIARELDIAEATVKVHVKSVLRKIRVKNRTQAATWAWAHCSRPPVPVEPSADELDGGAGAGPSPQPAAVNGAKLIEGTEQTIAPGLAIEFAGAG